jgi:LDH2 family malate/lactate/ureidoglycolate dehydrogenase
VIFTVGLGGLVNDNDGCDTSVYSVAECNDAEVLGEELLRYVAAVGDDGNPTTNPCGSVATGNDCGNYYFSPTGSGVLQVFEAIAGRIFTRITH